MCTTKLINSVAVVLAVVGWIMPARAGLFSLTEADEVAIGQQAAIAVEKQASLLRNQPLQHYIQRLGGALASRSTRPHLPWRFRVIRDHNINAFALPGGFIYIHSKTLQVVASEAELASVLAHEIGHIEAYHHRAHIERAMKYQLGLGVLGAVLGTGGGADYALIAGNLLAQGQLTKYSRRAEADADRRSVNLLHRSRFNPMASSRFLKHLLTLERGQSALLTSFFADHPDAASRVRVTRQQAASLPVRNWRRDSDDFRRLLSRHRQQSSQREGMRIRPGYNADKANQPERQGARIIAP